MKNTSIITPNWYAPANVQAYTSTRLGGHSQADYASMNLSFAVGDKNENVVKNIHQLMQDLNLPSEPKWLDQVHGTRVVLAEQATSRPAADASVTQQSAIVCAVLTADCLPILVCDQAGSMVAAIHAGWRSLAAGIIEETLALFPQPLQQLQVWLGPSISQDAFEVGIEVRDQFVTHNPQAAQCFRPQGTCWYADLYGLARQRLQHCGVIHISGGNHCTYNEPERFFSYRRDGQKSGRMASLIWLSGQK